MRNQRIQTIVEIALAVALAVLLNFLALRLPISIAGGSISLTMLPIGIVALRRGAGAGALAGAIFGLLDLLMEPFILVPVQVILDYPAPYLLFGFGVGLFMRAYRASADLHPATASVWIILAFIIGGILRYISHVLSGVFFFAEYAGTGNVWVYSFVYNITYLGPALAASLICALIIQPILQRAVPPAGKALEPERSSV